MAKISSKPGSNPSAKSAQGEQLSRHTPKSGTSFWARLWAQRQLMLMLLPGIAYYVIFCYMPMYGLRVAFMDYFSLDGYDGSPWVGLAHFERLFVNNFSTFSMLVGNTLLISLLTFGTSFPLTIVFALILNEVRMPKIKKAYQTISYLPTFLSGVIIASIFIQLFSVGDGIVNKVIVMFGGKPINFMLETSGFYTVYVVSGLWAGLGNGAIIYLSALAGVDQEMYEAAEIDGCSRLKRIIHITLPSISPTVITMFLLNIGSLIKVGADKALLLRTSGTTEKVQIFSTYVYDIGIADPSAQVSYPAAIGFFESVVSGILLISFNYISKKRSGTSIW
ncbi:MAG: sugar ABC transporter permease [Ruminococcaceae bacterium]|nr:sugar ABC transporter permease [Oscillospiraceae bacterium]